MTENETPPRSAEAKVEEFEAAVVEMYEMIRAAQDQPADELLEDLVDTVRFPYADDYVSFDELALARRNAHLWSQP